MKFTLLFAVFFAHAARADMQCMARWNGAWSVVELPAAKMSEGECSPSFSYGSQTYHLSSGPSRRDDQVTCQWEWAGATQVFPPKGAAESFACNLFL
jgi:hypothetical protein